MVALLFLIEYKQYYKKYDSPCCRNLMKLDETIEDKEDNDDNDLITSTYML